MNLIKHLAFGFITISSIVFLITSCAKEWSVAVQKYKFGYLNESAHEVTIIAYNAGIDSTYHLGISELFEFEMDLTRKGTFNNFMIYDSDSVLILFGESHFRLFTRDSISNRNPIFLKNYEYLRVTSSGDWLLYEQFIYKITNTDFENANLMDTLP